MSEELRSVYVESDLHKQLSSAFDAAKGMEPTFKLAEIVVKNGHKVPFYTWIKISDSPSAALKFCVNGKMVGLFRYLLLVAKWRVLNMFRRTTPGLNAVIASTIKRRGKDIADNVERNNGLYARLKNEGSNRRTG